jgi:hypothetical protein
MMRIVYFSLREQFLTEVQKIPGDKIFVTPSPIKADSLRSRLPPDDSGDVITIAKFISLLMESLWIPEERPELKRKSELLLIFGILRNIEEKNYSLYTFLSLTNVKSIEYLGEAYVLGSKLYTQEKEKTLIQELNNLIFTISQKIAKSSGVEIVNEYKDSNKFDKVIVEKIYDKGRKESLDYFENIYRKLEVSSRSEAVEKGKKLFKV